MLTFILVIVWILAYLVNLGLVSSIADRFDTREVERCTTARRMLLIFALGPFLTLFIGLLMIFVGQDVFRGWIRYRRLRT